jgi:hypothetical protein
MSRMPPSRRRPLAVALTLVAAVAVAGCDRSAVASAAAASSAGATGAPAATMSTDPRPSVAHGPSLTPVPGGATIQPDPAATRIPTTQTDWGEILDALPRSFPLYPGAEIADLEGGPFSGTFEVPTDAAAAATWYRDAFSASGDGTELSDPLEDASRVLDVQADLPECRIQMTFRPQDGSTIITVLVASACANGTEG